MVLIKKPFVVSNICLCLHVLFIASLVSDVSMKGSSLISKKIAPSKNFKTTMPPLNPKIARIAADTNFKTTTSIPVITKPKRNPTTTTQTTPTTSQITTVIEETTTTEVPETTTTILDVSTTTTEQETTSADITTTEQESTTTTSADITTTEQETTTGANVTTTTTEQETTSSPTEQTTTTSTDVQEQLIEVTPPPISILMPILNLVTQPPPQEMIAIETRPPPQAMIAMETRPPPQAMIARTTYPPPQMMIARATYPPPQMMIARATYPPPQMMIARVTYPPPQAMIARATSPITLEMIRVTYPPPQALIAMATDPPTQEVTAMASAPELSLDAPLMMNMANDVNTGSTNTTVSQPVTTASNAGLQHHQLNSLLESVLVGYDRRIRPRSNQARFVTIFSDFVPNSIIEFDTQEQRFSVTGYFKMDWRDDFLTWDPTAYEDTKYLRIPVKSIWIPKLSIDKSFVGNGIVGDVDTDIALISYKGYVRWFPEGIYSVSCKVTIRFYPFDIQTCEFSYFVADEDNSTINLKHYDAVDLSEYIENAEWKLNSLTATREQVDDKFIVKYQFNVERRGGFVMFTLVVPVLMLSMLSGTTFLIPIETGEKCSFSVTVFLAYGIFETVVIDTLPHNSLDVSYFILYLTSLLIVSVLLTFYTILQAKVFDAVGERQIAFCRGKSQGDAFTWGTFLRKLDTFIFVGFLVLVLGLTTIFAAVMGDQVDFV